MATLGRTAALVRTECVCFGGFLLFQLNISVYSGEASPCCLPFTKNSRKFCLRCKVERDLLANSTGKSRDERKLGWEVPFSVPFTRFTCFVLVSGLLALSALPRVKRCGSIRKFWVDVKQPVTFLPNGNSQPKFPEILGKW